MKNILYIIILITLLAVIIISGCGGGNDGVTHSSLTIPTPNNLTGYITIKITWPQKGLTGSCIISSGNDEGTLTASIPGDASHVEVKIRDANEPTSNNTLTNGYYSFIWNHQNSQTIEHTFGPLPAIKVIIRAEAYTPGSDTTPVSVSEQEYQVKVGHNNNNDNVTLNLGDYDLTLTADPNTIVLGGSSVSGSSLISNVTALPTPTPGRTVIKNNLTPMNPCMAEITPEGSPLPTDTPTPTPTPIRVSSDITATLMITYPTPTANTGSASIPTPKFIANKQITFTLIQGNDEYTTLSSKETIESDTVTGTTTNNGTCTIKLLAGTTGDKVIKASFQADSNDPNSVYSDQCTVIVITPTPTPTPIRTPTNLPMNVAGNWGEADGSDKIKYTIIQSGAELTFTCISTPSPTDTPTPATTPPTPPSIPPTPTLKPLPSEGSWIGYIQDNHISMWPPSHEPMIGTVGISGGLYIEWIGGYSKRRYTSWVRK